MPKLENIDAEVKLLQTIHETFARIFQALIVMLEDKSLFTQLPNEAEKLSKRSREFEVRLNRSVFEAKQQVTIILQSNLAIRNFLVTLKLFLNAKSSLFL